MARIIQIRNVPNRVHRILKKRAKQEGISLAAYIRRDIQDFAARPTMAEVLARLDGRKAVNPPISAAEVLRQGREERDREMDGWIDQLNPTPLK